MVFADLFFLYFFLALCFICYFKCKTVDSKNTALIIFSLIFYFWGEPLWYLLVLSAFVNWILGIGIGLWRDRFMSKFCTGLAVFFDLGMLIVFKYSGFIMENINYFFNENFVVPKIQLPIGISFFTFQAISYIMDCYWENVKVQTNFKKYLLYLSLFPQLIAGPIVRYSVIEKEISERKSTPVDLSDGALRMIIGLSKKTILANHLYIIVEEFFGKDITNLSFLGTWYAVIIYSLYVYFDFSGYSDMAIGLGRMFGFHFDENFNYPFICKTISEFWQRWHISLSSFFRDYLFYMPVFGRPRKYFNLFLVWFCTGMWHGASWNFIIWGLYFGIFIFIETKIGKKKMKKIPRLITHIYSKLVIIIGFGIFYFTDLNQLLLFFKNITGISMAQDGNTFSDIMVYDSFMANLYLILFSILVCMPIVKKIRYFFFEWGNNTIYAIGKIGATIISMGLLILCSILLVNNTNNPFLYFRF